MIQARVPSPTAINKTIFVSPLRDCSHFFPFTVRQAIQLANDRMDKLPDNDPEKTTLITDLGVLAVAYAKWVKIAATEPAVEDYNTAKSNAGLIKNSATPWMDEALRDAMLQMYFNGIREAHHGEPAIGLDTLMKFIEERPNGNPTATTPN